MKIIAKNRKIAFQTVSRKRNGRVSHCLNSVRMTFSEEPAGTKMYIKETNNGFMMSTSFMENSSIKEVKMLKSRVLSDKPQQYLNFRGLAKEEKEYDIYSPRLGMYILEPSKVQIKTKTVAKRMNGLCAIGLNNTIRLPSAWVDKQLCGHLREECCFVIEESYRPYLYMAIRIATKKEAENILELNEICGKRLMKELEQDKIIYKKNISLSFGVNRFFRKAANAEYASVMKIQEDAEGRMIVTPKKHICDFCGRTVAGDITKMFEIDVCSECNDAIQSIKKHTSDGQISLNSVKKELLAVSEELTQIYNELMKEGK